MAKQLVLHFLGRLLIKVAVGTVTLGVIIASMVLEIWVASLRTGCSREIRLLRRESLAYVYHNRRHSLSRATGLHNFLSELNYIKVCGYIGDMRGSP